MALNNDHCTYRVTWAAGDHEYVGSCVEFPSLSRLSETPESALTDIREVVGEVVRDMEQTGEDVAQPFACKNYSGKFMVRVPPGIHRTLAMQAAEAGVSLNRMASAKLSR